MSDRDVCVVRGCNRWRMPGWPWCESHRPRFDKEPLRTPYPRLVRDRVAEAIRRWPDWNDEAIAAWAGVTTSYTQQVRKRLGLLRDRSTGVCRVARK